MASLSQFVTVSRKEDKTVLFNILKGQMALTSKNYFETLNNGIISGLPIQLRLSLLKSGMIVPNAESEVDFVYREYQKHKTGGPVLCFTITPTYQCNCACRSCFQQSYDKSIKMTDDVFKSVVGFIERQMKLKSPAAVVLWLYGGEPFLMAESMTDLVNCVKSACRSKKITGYVYSTTNGTLITSHKGKKLIDAIDHVYLSLCQSEAKQAVERPFKNGRNSYQKVLMACQYLAEKQKQVTMRLNVSDVSELKEDLQHLFDDLYLAFGNQSYEKISFECSFLNHKIQHCLLGEEEANSNKDRDFSLNTIMRDIISQGDFNWGLQHFKLPVESRVITYNSSACGFELCGYLRGDHHFIAPDGSLYFCNITENNSDFLIGNTLNPDTVQDNPMYIAARDFNPFGSPTCKSCCYLPLCLRDCPLQEIKQGTSFKRKGCVEKKKALVEKEIEYLWNNWQPIGRENGRPN